jgi:hypothetical protein
MLSFYAGSTAILSDEFAEAKARLHSILNDSVDSVTAALAFNNFGVACWWARFPNYSFLEDEYEELAAHRSKYGDAHEMEPSDDEEEFTPRSTAPRSRLRVRGQHVRVGVYKLELGLEQLRSPDAPDDDPPAFDQGPERHMKRVFAFINDDFGAEDTLKEYLRAERRGRLFRNPLTAVPLFNLAEMMLATGEEEKDRRQGLAYLHFAHRLLAATLDRIDAFRRARVLPPEWTAEDFGRFFLDFEGQYRGLFIRSHVFFSKVQGLDNVG